MDSASSNVPSITLVSVRALANHPKERRSMIARHTAIRNRKDFPEDPFVDKTKKVGECIAILQNARQDSQDSQNVVVLYSGE